MILLPLACGLGGALLLGFGLFCFFRDRRHLPRYSEVGEGIVSGFTEPDEEGFVRLQVQFVHGGKTFTTTGDIGHNPPTYRVGQRVAVRYPPGEPDSAIIADFRHLYLFEFAAIVIGAAGVGTALLLLVLQWSGLVR
jgi:hypothetical protein